ncbi:TlpA disulfide reductase family protein [uncultured Bacteroides sp.]|uniref:TlpA disulfide reductase family protein n=1 Tax=uncultured Bacteroides sp. TaxID=162156 RepID=UPI00262FEFAA|nr:TlpA disulfide reductase family protein [uncultured Bacteroides sp.]
MNKLLNGFVLFGLLAVGSISCNKQNGYEIQGQIDDVDSGTIYLKCYRDGNFQIVDSATVNGGSFTFKGNTDQPLVYGLTTSAESRRPLSFLIGNEKIQTRLNESEKKIEVTGSLLNDQLVQNSQIASLDNIDSLIRKDPRSIANAYLFVRNFAPQMDYNQIQTIRSQFDGSLKGSEYMNRIDTLLSQLKNLQIGATAPDFTLPDTLGNPITLSSLRGNYVLIDFWASWCPDCRKENPNVVAAHKQFNNNNLIFLGISLDTKKEPWLKAIQKDSLAWNHVSDLKGWDSDVAKLYAIKWIPRNYLIDPNGVILASGLEGEKLIQKLKEIFN